MECNNTKKTPDNTSAFPNKSEYNELMGHMPSLLRTLREHNLLPDFMSLIRLIVSGKMSAVELPLLLLLEKARFCSLPSTNLMFYWPQTLKFWRVVYRLLKGKAIRLFSGPKSQGAILEGATNGACKPEGAELNFAVPNLTVLRTASGDEAPLPKAIKPGIVAEAVTIARKSKKGYVLCMDGKKVAMGLQGDCGDIDLWGHEADGGLAVRKQELQAQLQIGKEIINDLSDIDTELPLADVNPALQSTVLNRTKSFVQCLSYRIRSSRELILQQMHALEKFEKLSETEEGAQKYQYALSSTKAILYEARVHVKHALKVVGSLLHKASQLSMGRNTVSSTGPIIDVSTQENMVQLKDPKDLPEGFQCPEYTKQRTDEWKEIRKQAVVTGSSLHNALGLRTLKDQKQHFDSHVKGHAMPEFSPDVLKRMEAGVEGEPHAAVTLAAGFMPVFFPSSDLIEDGARFITTDGPLIEVSTDGFIRSGNNVSHIVEIKCPQPSSHSTPVQYQVPHYYVCQLLAEMASHGVNTGLFVSYSPESTAISEVCFDEDLWNEIVQEVRRVYGDNARRPSKLGPVVAELKNKIAAYVKTNVSLLAELPSLRSEVIGDLQTIEESPYLFASARPPVPLSTVGELVQSISEGAEVVNEGFRLCRRKASEILAFVLSDVDRQQNLEVPYHLPVAYAMKGYSLPVNIARGMLKEVVHTLYEYDVEVACLSTDGQFHNIICRGLGDRPLTLGQLQKDVWKSVVKMAKPELQTNIKSLGLLDSSSWTALTHGAVIEKSLNSGGYIVCSKGSLLSRVKIPVAATVWNTVKPTSPCEEKNGPVVQWSWTNTERAMALLARLKAVSPVKFQQTSITDLQQMTSSVENIYSQFNVRELDTVMSSLPHEMQLVKPKKSWNKCQKANWLAKTFCDGQQKDMPAPIRSVGTLKKLAFGAVRDQYPKLVLGAIWAQVIWPEKLAEWKRNGTVVHGLAIDALGAMQWYSQMERFEGKLLPACVDPSHLLTNMRVKVTKHGITGVPREAFLRVAEKHPDILNKALVTDLLDKQNVAFACRVFSEKVSQKMEENGDHGAAEFVTLIREWYEAVDSPGLPAEERVQRLYNMRLYLLHKHWEVDFSRFPPLGSHVKGIPYIWFDSMLQGIDTRIQMYGIVGTYSHRALGTLPVESFFGDLSEMDQTKLGCPKAIHIPRLMACTTEINSYRHDPSSR